MLHQILLLLSGAMRLVKRSSHCCVNSTCTSALAKGRTHGAMNQTNTKVICYPERQTAITISVTSHWLNHLFFSGATGMENSFNLHVYETKKCVLTVENILIHVSLTSCLNRLSHAGSLCCPGWQM